MKNVTSILIVFFTFGQTLTFSQDFVVSVEPGFYAKSKSYADGPGINLNILLLLQSRHGVGFIIGHSFMDSSNNIPKDLSEANFNLRDYTNIPPLNIPGLNSATFEPIRLSSQPNRYFNIFIGINYFYDFYSPKSLKAGTEMLITYRDQMEISRVVNAKSLNIWLSDPLYDYNIPVFSYNTYLDIGIAPYLQYDLLRYKRLNIGIKTKVYIFPKSREMIYNIAAILTWRKNR